MFQNVNGQHAGKFRGKSGIGYHFQTTNFKRRKYMIVAVIFRQTLRQTLKHTLKTGYEMFCLVYRLKICLKICLKDKFKTITEFVRHQIVRRFGD
jgi:hypothetical protein